MKKKINAYFENSQPKITEYTKDRQKTKDLVEKVKDKVFKKEGTLDELVDSILTMGEMIKLSSQRKYKKLPFKTFSSIILAFFYFLMPADLIPDFIAVTGLSDDIAVFTLVLNNISKDIQTFKEWKEEEKNKANENVSEKLQKTN